MDETHTEGVVREVHDDDQENKLTGQAAHWRDVFLQMFTELSDKEGEDLSLMGQGFVAALSERADVHYVLGDLMAHIDLSWSDVCDDVFQSLRRFAKEDPDCHVALHEEITDLLSNDTTGDYLSSVKDMFDLMDEPDWYQIKEAIDTIRSRMDEIESEASGARDDLRSLERALDCD